MLYDQWKIIKIVFNIFKNDINNIYFLILRVIYHLNDSCIMTLHVVHSTCILYVVECTTCNARRAYGKI